VSFGLALLIPILFTLSFGVYPLVFSALLAELVLAFYQKSSKTAIKPAHNRHKVALFLDFI
jgi:hypothetical protein